jgi:hypothetical protein
MKKTGPIVSLLIGCMKFLFLKLFVTNFWPMLMVRAEIEQGRKIKNNFPLSPCPPKEKTGAF